MVCEVLLDGTHSQAKPYIFMFWPSLDPLSGSTFAGVALGVCFCRFYMISRDFGSTLELLLPPFGTLVREHFQIFLGTSKNRSLDYKRATFICYGVSFLSIRDAISEDLGWHLNSYSLGVPQRFLRHSLGIIHVFFRYSLGIP